MQLGSGTVSRLAGIAIFMAYCVIVLGAATRVWDAGMSCPDWPQCYGLWWPFGQNNFVVNGQHYAAYQVALEWGHRLLAALTGMAVLPMVVLAWKHPQLRGLGIAVLAVLAVQVKLGAVTVWFSNVNWSVALHLGNAMIFLGLLVWYKKLVYAPMPLAMSNRLWAIGCALFAVLVWLTMVVGATVSSSHAGGICGGLPSCAGSWWPADSLQQVHMLHRLLGVSVLCMTILLVVLAKISGISIARQTAKGLHVLVWGQVVLGVVTLYSFELYPAWYQWLSTAHLAWGTLLWMAAVGAVLKVRYGDERRFHG